MAESVIVGYYTSAEVPFPRRKQPGCAFAEPFSSVRRTYIAHGWCERGFQRGAASLAHDFGTKSCVLLHLGQHRTIPALRLKHRSGGYGTASALPKCSIMSGCGTRIVLRGQKPLALCDRCPCFGSLYPPLAALTFAASSIICAFGLAAAAPRSPYRHLELCGIALGLIFRGGCPSGRPKALRCRPRRGCDAVSTCCPPISKGGDCGNGRPGA